MIPSKPNAGLGQVDEEEEEGALRSVRSCAVRWQLMGAPADWLVAAATEVAEAEAVR